MSSILYIRTLRWLRPSVTVPEQGGLTLTNLRAIKRVTCSPVFFIQRKHLMFCSHCSSLLSGLNQEHVIHDHLLLGLEEHLAESSGNKLFSELRNLK